jgi:DNA-binding XRE family transcriptional regulator
MTAKNKSTKKKSSKSKESGETLRILGGHDYSLDELFYRPKLNLEDLQVLLRKNLKFRIREAGYKTIESFAHDHNIAKSTLSQILNHNRDPRLSTLIMLANSLDSSLTSFFYVPNPTPEDWDEL